VISFSGIAVFDDAVNIAWSRGVDCGPGQVLGRFW